LALLPADLRRRLRVVQQARPEDAEAVVAAYGASGIEAEVSSFFRNLPERMAEAHLVIARSGASTVAELTVIGRPSILVPLPHALDNDQLQNASRLAESGAAWCIEQKHLTSERLARTIEDLLGAPEKLASAAAAARELGRPEAVVRLADLVEELMGRRRG
jgi:UDP-N-acetylglucosamine--N-acetylmuramyl-(pentapeptide) pyrophosphoryl-undecaprenol N-acetylglucosamine transferase